MPTPWTDDILLAPLTKGGNLPFRRLCVDLGARVTCSEMAYAHNLAKGLGRELALLRHHPSETCFGVQIAAHKAEVAAEGTQIAVERGAKWVDLNCGCPIQDTVKRGMGARLLERADTLEAIVRAMVDAAGEVPVTVKIRLGYREGKENADDIGRRVEDAGAAALIVHGRTREQRYSRAADWEAIGRVVRERTIPVAGNGDILTWYEARHRREVSGVAAVMLGRGALIKPWLFDEIREGRERPLSAEERVGLYYTLSTYFKEHFGDDDLGYRRTMFFLPWHFGFFCRYVALPEDPWEARSREHPLMQTRDASPSPRDAQSPLDALLIDGDQQVHREMADALWVSVSVEDAQERVVALAVRRASEGVAPRGAGRLDSGGWG
jgi:tRNA-dihydrouridine synthase 3